MVDEANPKRMMIFHEPREPQVLKTLGMIALRHSYLDHILKMTIKSLAGIEPQEALDATAFQTSGTLRERIVKIARRKLGEGTALLRLQALLERARCASEQRNDFMHGVWAQELDGEPQMRGNDRLWKPIPTVQELEVVASDILQIAEEKRFLIGCNT